MAGGVMEKDVWFGLAPVCKLGLTGSVHGKKTANAADPAEVYH